MKLSISMTRWETLLGWSYLLISQVVLPSLLALVGHWLEFSLTEFNILYFCVNFIFVAVIFHRFLWKSVQVFWAKWWRCLLYVAGGFIVYFLCAMMVSVIITPWIGANFSNVNDEAVIEMAREHTVIMGICIVLIGPITEEMLFRGVVFQGLHRKNRTLAYCVSVLLFAAVHILDYIGYTDWKTLVICFLQYLPAGIALASIYEASDTVVTPMLLHIALNLRSFSAMR